MISRREFMAGSVALAASTASKRLAPEAESILVNDVHSQLIISIAGGRHAMGGQQFGTDTLLIDIRKLSRVLSLDRKRGIIEVEAGIEWPELIKGYLTLQNGDGQGWGIAQKQTGADRLTIAGTIAANAHGRGLTIERRVEIRTVDDLIATFEKRIADGFQYGDFQFSIEQASDDFLHKGVFSCYRPVPMDTPIPSAEKQLTDENWRQLLYLAHTDKKQAFSKYADYYLSTNGQVYWSDLHQLSTYPDNYHREIDDKLNTTYPATEMITEINVPRPALSGFLDEVREDFRKNKVELIYGTVRLIERDDESFLPWAKQSYACTIFNLHTIHSPGGLQRSEYAFRRLIDMAARRGGTYYLTYHRYATRNQVESCYPQFAEFLRLKKKYDPEERFQSDWYRHYRTMFADSL